MNGNLFGHPVIPDGPAMTPLEKKRLLRRAQEVPRGYFATPGTGPEGETCKTCVYSCYIQLSKRYYKCERPGAPLWTGGPRTDIRMGSPACKGWEAKTP